MVIFIAFIIGLVLGLVFGGGINQRMIVDAKKSKYNTPPVIKGKYLLKDEETGNPFKKLKPVIVLEVIDGWVSYQSEQFDTPSNIESAKIASFNKKYSYTSVKSDVHI